MLTPTLLGPLLFSSATWAESLPKTEPLPAVPHVCGIDKPLGATTASVGIMYNLAEHPKSMRVVASDLLAQALVETAPSPSKPGCDNCAGSISKRVLYRVAPTVFLPAKEQPAVCVRLEETTRAQPFTYPARSFNSVAALNDWVMAFSRGHSPEGKDLYARCVDTCSPRYQFLVAPEGGSLAVQTQVQCGLARDVKSDEYAVSTALRAMCEVAPASALAAPR